MKWLKYTYRSVVQEQDMEGNPVEREVFTEMAVPDNENGRALAEKEAYDGVIEEYDDGQPEPVKPETDEPTFDDMAEAIKEGVNEV
ncbi:MAG: hypothetical protein IKT57_05875 [Clostridia bacterium]|nr:hypothetical protein [Clostridia bacterium]